MPTYYLDDKWAWKWWDVKLAAAIRLATTACGITKEHLMEVKELSFLYRFHVYFTVATTMYITETPIPGDLSLKVFDESVNEKLWMSYLHELGQPSNGGFYVNDEGPLGIYWAEKKQNIYYKTKKNPRVYLTERYHEIKSMDYKNRSFYALKQWINSWAYAHQIFVARHWLTDTPGYKNMKNEMIIDNNEWNKIIPDKHMYLPDAGKLLFNKSLMVYTYSIYAALSSPHGGNVEIIREQFI